MLVCPKSPSYDQNPGKKQTIKNPSSAHYWETTQMSNNSRMDVCSVVLSHSGYCTSRMGNHSAHHSMVDSHAY